MDLRLCVAFPSPVVTGGQRCIFLQMKNTGFEKLTAVSRPLGGPASCRLGFLVMAIHTDKVCIRRIEDRSYNQADNHDHLCRLLSQRQNIHSYQHS